MIYYLSISIYLRGDSAWKKSQKDLSRNKRMNQGAPLLLASILALPLFIFPSRTQAQDINRLKAGVVRIKNNRSSDVGTGFIVKIDGDQVYIITASHVVKGDQYPHVFLFTQQRDALRAELLDREEDDIKGLALLRLKMRSAETAGITALKLGHTTQLGGGEDVKVIGFPDSTAFWTVGNGSIARIEGRNLVFSGAIRGGNSGGPVVLNGLVIGMVTDVSQSAVYAARSEIMEPYINGIIPNLISRSKEIDERGPTPTDQQVAGEVNELCQAIAKIVEASRGDFTTLTEKTSVQGSPTSAISVPGFTTPSISPDMTASLSRSLQNKSEVEAEYYRVTSSLNQCFPRWEQIKFPGGLDGEGLRYRRHLLSEGEEGPGIEISYSLSPPGTLVTLTVFSPNSIKLRLMRRLRKK